MDADQIEKLKALALAAPAGPWTWGMKYVAKPEANSYTYLVQRPDGEEESPAWEVKAKFMASANPATVLELIAEDERKANRIAELEAEVEKLRADAERYRWLRDPVNTEGPSFVSCYGTDSLDRIIDAAIEKEKA